MSLFNTFLCDRNRARIRMNKRSGYQKGKP